MMHDVGLVALASLLLLIFYPFLPTLLGSAVLGATVVGDLLREVRP
jgi:hypothetical protein